MSSERAALRERAHFRRAAAFGAQTCPVWFVRGAPVVIGVLFALFGFRTRRAVSRNLVAIRGKVGPLRHFRETVSTFVEFARALTAALAPGRPIFSQRKIDLVGVEHVRPLLDSGTGMLMLTAHVGPWDACAFRLRSMMDVPVLMLMSGEADPEAGAFQDELRKSAHIRVLRIGKNPLDALALLEHLRSGGVVVAQLDRLPASGRGISTSLFSRAFAVPEGIFRVAAALECPVVPVFAARLDSDTDRVVVSAPVRVPKRPNSRALEVAARSVVTCLEAHLRRFPTQWFHFVQ